MIHGGTTTAKIKKASDALLARSHVLVRPRKGTDAMQTCSSNGSRYLARSGIWNTLHVLFPSRPDPSRFQRKEKNAKQDAFGCLFDGETPLFGECAQTCAALT